MATEPVARDTMSLASIKTVSDAANESQTLLGEMRQAATDAGTTLTEIYQDAKDAETAAGEAQTSAASAQNSANGALKGLSTVQDVIGVLDWAKDNATYTLTSDTDIVPGKTYWTRSGSGTEADPYTYTPIVTPVKADLGTYYEISGVDEAMADYINTHLALTDEGLYVLGGANQWKVLVATDGVYIIDGTSGVDKIVAKYKDAITLGIDNGSQSYAYEDYHSFQMFDKEAAEIIANASEWDSKSAYEVGDIIIRPKIYDITHYYQCITAIPASETPRPWGDSYAANWKEIYPNSYLHISDLRDEFGVAYLTETLILKADTNTVYVSYPMYNNIIEDISVNGNHDLVIRTSYDTDDFWIEIIHPTPSEGDIVKVTYATKGDSSHNPQLLKAYTLGLRKSSSVIGIMSFAEGIRVTASGWYSHAEGNGTTASGQSSHAEGVGTTASNTASHAEGDSTTASDIASHAEGVSTTASNNASHAEGVGTTASDTASHAEGYETTANGAYSHVEGEYSEATGTATHAEGYATKASGRFSHSQNMGTIASKDSQTAIGRYNEEDNESGLAQKAFIIGNGTSDTNRSNGFTVDWNGNTEMQGRTTTADMTTAEITAFINELRGVTP